MTNHELSDANYRRDMGDGLVLRWSNARDEDALAELLGFVFRPKADAAPNERIGEWAREWLRNEHPLITPGDVAVVERANDGKLVAATCLVVQEWEYAGIPFGVGRPETVASLPEHRNRGLIRAIFGLIHARSAAQGHLAQGITGIPYYYRQYGYEFALDLGGMRTLSLDAVPKLKDGDPEPYTLRTATSEDLPQLHALYERERTRGLVSARISDAYWQTTFGDQVPASGEGWRTLMIVDAAGATQGYVLHRRIRWGDTLGIVGLSVAEGVSLAALLPSILRALKGHALVTPLGRPTDDTQPTKLGFDFGRSHPVYDLLGDTLVMKDAKPYAWYVRVPDLPGFIRHIAPVLEQRLANSAYAGHTGEVRIDFYRGGLRLAFEQGKLSAAEDWRREIWVSEPQAGFPPLVFLQVLFGHRSLAELRHAFPDAWANDDVSPLLQALFPAHYSWVLPLD